jgi:hypothetical protein
MPVECATPNTTKAPLRFLDSRCDYQVGDGTTAGWNGFLNATIDGNLITLDYRDLNNTSLFVESFRGNPDATLEYSYQTPPPVLTSPQ